MIHSSRNRRSRALLPVYGAIVAASLAGTAEAAIIVTLGAPKAEYPNFTGPNGVCSTAANATCVFGTETFSNWTGGAFVSNFSTGQHILPTGTSISGAFAGGISYDTNNTYGGAGGTAPYPSAKGASNYTLSLSSSGIPGINYFGVWITAMDASNKLTLFSNGSAVFNFVSSDLRAAIAGTTTPSQYFGHPDSGLDSSEPFAYVNVFNTTGFFDKVQFSNTGGTNFENSVNAAGYFNPLNVNGTVVTVTTNTVPEAASLAILTTSLLSLTMLRRPETRRARTAGGL